MSTEESASTTAAAQTTKDKAISLAQIVGRNLHEMRVQRDLTLESLSRISGVSRAMLWQIERAKSAPTITVLSRLADALAVPVSSFLAGAGIPPAIVLRKSESTVLAAEGGGFVSRALSPMTDARTMEFHELHLEVGAVEGDKGRRDGTHANVVVSTGSVQIDVGGETYSLRSGDALYFRADAPHRYRNIGTDPSILYLVIVYPARRDSL